MWSSFSDSDRQFEQRIPLAMVFVVVPSGLRRAFRTENSDGLFEQRIPLDMHGWFTVFTNLSQLTLWISEWDVVNYNVNNIYPSLNIGLNTDLNTGLNIKNNLEKTERGSKNDEYKN